MSRPPYDGGVFPQHRARRLRGNPILADLVGETVLRPSDFIAPIFVREGIPTPVAIESLPGVSQHSVDSMLAEVQANLDVGVRAVILFGVPENKDSVGSGASDPDGIVQVAIRALRKQFGTDVYVIADLCLDEYTDHGHCGIVTPAGEVDNDSTLQRYQEVAIAQAEAGVDMVAPSGMMDGQVAAIRASLERSGFVHTPILAYSAKYASALYGPFRDAVDVTISGGGDRTSYQQDIRNSDESMREIRQDISEGADIVMVKPALTYLDVIQRAHAEFDVPLAAYHTSGEYAMIHAAAARGWVDLDAVVCEQMIALKRGGCDMILTYFASSVASMLS